MPTWTEDPGGSGLYELTPGASVPTFEIMPRVGPNPMVVHRTADSNATTVTAAIRPDAQHLRLRPGRAIRVGVAHVTLGTRWLFRGFIDEILPVDTPEDWSTVTLKCIDALGEAGRAKIVSDTETGADEQARTRFARILNEIQWPATKRSISTSAIRELYAAELDGQVVDLLRQTADSEGGACYADVEGRILLQHHDWLLRSAADPVDATIGNVGVGDVCPGRWERSFARGDITTRVIVEADSPDDIERPSAIVTDDPQAQVLYGIEPYEKDDLWTRDANDRAQIAYRILASRSATLSMPRIKGVSIQLSDGSPDNAIDLLTRLSVHTPSRYRGRLQTDRGLVFDTRFFAVGVTHDLSAEEWTADISLDRAYPYERLDPVDYVWDTGRWDRSLWN